VTYRNCPRNYNQKDAVAGSKKTNTSRGCGLFTPNERKGKEGCRVPEEGWMKKKKQKTGEKSDRKKKVGLGPKRNGSQVKNNQLIKWDTPKSTSEKWERKKKGGSRRQKRARIRQEGGKKKGSAIAKRPA